MNEGNLIGIGREKVVRPDPSSENRVVKRYIEQRTGENVVRGRFYFGKILHELFPQSFPDIHQSTTKPNQVVMERVPLDSEHVAIQKILNKIRSSEGIVSPEEDSEQSDYMDKRREDSRVVKATEQLDSIGVKFFDRAAINFSVTDDAAVYVDNISPWIVEIVHKEDKSVPEVVLNFDLDTVEKLLSLIENEHSRERMKSFLKRIVELHEIEREKFRKEREEFFAGAN